MVNNNWSNTSIQCWFVCLHFFSFCISLLSWYTDKSHAKFHNNLLLCCLLLRLKIIAFNCESSEGLGFPESSTVWRAHLSWRETHIQYWRNLIRTLPPTHPRTAAVRNALICIQTWCWWSYSVNIETKSMYSTLGSSFLPSSPGVHGGSEHEGFVHGGRPFY